MKEPINNGWRFVHHNRPNLGHPIYLYAIVEGTPMLFITSLIKSDTPDQEREEVWNVRADLLKDFRPIAWKYCGENLEKPPYFDPDMTGYIVVSRTVWSRGVVDTEVSIYKPISEQFDDFDRVVHHIVQDKKSL